MNCDFFANKTCEYFPCHKTLDEENFNCMFCYCPLYFMGTDCGGKYIILNNGVKDCSACMLPHGRASAEYIRRKLKNNNL